MKDCIKYVRAPNGNFEGEPSNELNPVEANIFISEKSDATMRNCFIKMIDKVLQGRKSLKKRNVAIILHTGEFERFLQESEERKALIFESLDPLKEFDEIFCIDGMEELEQRLKITEKGT